MRSYYIRSHIISTHTSYHMQTHPPHTCLTPTHIIQITDNIHDTDTSHPHIMYTPTLSHLTCILSYIHRIIHRISHTNIRFTINLVIYNYTNQMRFRVIVDRVLDLHVADLSSVLGTTQRSSKARQALRAEPKIRPKYCWM